MSVASRRRSPKRTHEPAPGPAAKTATLPYTGKEFLASLDGDREIWIYGERVKNITKHPAFQNCARMLARRTTRSTRTTSAPASCRARSSTAARGSASSSTSSPGS